MADTRSSTRANEGIPVAPDAHVTDDLPCLKCGYNLRSLPVTADCPECGTSVHESARLAWLSQHEPKWLRKLSRATIWIGIATTCVMVYLCMALLATVSIVSVPVGVVFVFIGILALGAVAAFVGCWQITCQHPRTRIGRIWVRLVARWSVVASIACFLLAILVLFLYGSDGTAVPLVICSVLFLGIGTWATLTYASCLAAKIPEVRLVRQARIIAWGFGSCFMLFAMALIAQWLAGSRAFGFSAEAVLVLIGVLATGAIILGIWTIPLLVWYRRRFREALAISQRRANEQGR